MIRAYPMVSLSESSQSANALDRLKSIMLDRIPWDTYWQAALSRVVVGRSSRIESLCLVESKEWEYRIEAIGDTVGSFLKCCGQSHKELQVSGNVRHR